MNDNKVVVTENLVKDYQIARNEFVHVLKGVNLTVNLGEFIAIMGPSGIGKSTLLNVLSTLEPITSGDVFIAGINIKDIPITETLKIRRTVSSIVFQNFALIPYLTALENIMLPIILRGESHETAAAIAHKLIQQVGLAPRSSHLPEELSGGEQQRVAIARALAHNPQIIYADEPTGNLDTKTGLEIINIFRNLAHNKNITVIMVTHDHEAANRADKIYLLQNGKVKELLEKGENK